MEPIVENKSESKGILTFTLKNINVSLANALRRIIIAGIPTIVIRTMPHEKNDVDIEINTTRLNNEILKQRISCIPIHISDQLPLEELKEYEIIIHKKNQGDTIQFITTEDFVIKHKGKLISKSMVNQIFPPSPITNDYILFARLRPKISEDIPGEELKMKATLSYGDAKENGMFNIVSTCSYGMTPDKVKQYEIWERKEKELTKNSEQKVESLKENWMIHDAKRIYIPNSFNFVIESIGIFTNNDIIKRGIQELHNKLDIILQDIETQSIDIKESVNTIKNSFDIIINNEDYTIGKVLEYILYNSLYEGGVLSYIGFTKEHPHYSYGLLRLAYKKTEDNMKTIALEHLKIAVKKAKEIFQHIDDQF